jgi:hypothetical protein
MTKALSFLTLFSLMFFFGAAVRADEGRPEHGVPAGTIIVPDGLVGKEVQRAIMEAGAEEDFIVKTRDEQKVVLYREDGSWIAVLTFVYDTKEIQIYSKSVKSGSPKLPERWIKNLKKDISRKLNTVAITK